MHLQVQRHAAPLRAALTRAMHGIVQCWVAGNRLMFRVLGVTTVNVRLPEGGLRADGVGARSA